jgi:hypothetical protein
MLRDSSIHRSVWAKGRTIHAHGSAQAYVICLTLGAEPTAKTPRRVALSLARSRFHQLLATIHHLSMRYAH